MGQINFTVSLILAALFAIAVIGFAINFASDNNAPVDISDDSQLSSIYIQTRENVSSFRSGAESSYASLINSTIESGDQTTISGGQFKITPASAFGSVKNIILVGYTRIFGNDSGFGIFMTTLFSLMLFIAGLYLWKTWAGRNPD